MSEDRKVLPSGVVLTRRTAVFDLEESRWSDGAGVLRMVVWKDDRVYVVCAKESADLPTVAEALAWLDAQRARILAAMLPPDAEERVARACFEFDRACDWSERTNSDEETYRDQAVYVLAALGVNRG